MAIATLSELYNNHQVFTGVVKIRKGLAVLLINETKTEDGLYKWFYNFAKKIKSSIPTTDPNSKNTAAICEKIINLTEKRALKAI